ncbi:hypothetical protein ELH70_14715 [Rhizobium ruizarguesonis]|uniref:hypothetical protein n=1 Tax=Rhizobium ruizarguesonis TaxID=2081791 RepID=UPI0010315FD8|nr:hypothetical protein [Rhizobium ruizarguesonis]TAZ73819.1 hypothetical protein ELH70_14715 [Rhizobium ruizarguesonis]TBA00420.1 hypothetical protein ELH69_13900 [Rhizobium ruizarguesonis]
MAGQLAEHGQGMTYVLLDQGAMRHEMLQARISGNASTIFVIPDVAFSEMAIKKHVRYTLRRSLSPLLAAIDRTYVSVSVKEIVEFEKQSGGNVIRLHQLLSGRATRIGRALIQGDSSPDYPKIIARLDETELAHKSLFDPMKDLDAMRRHVLAFKKSFGTARLKLLRTPGAYSEEVKLGMITMIMQAMTRQPGMFDGDVTKRMLLVRLLLLMYWAEKDGLDNIKPEKIMNDFIDMEFVVIASYLDEILSADEKVKMLDRQVRRVMDIADAEKMITAARDTGFRTSE